jgi:hypothetical protein
MPPSRASLLLPSLRKPLTPKVKFLDCELPPVMSRPPLLYTFHSTGLTGGGGGGGGHGGGHSHLGAGAGVGASAGAAGFAAASAGATTSAAAGVSVCANARAGEKTSVVARIVGATSANRIFRVVIPFLRVVKVGPFCGKVRIISTAESTAALAAGRRP